MGGGGVEGARDGDKVNKLVSLVTSPDCPPEFLIQILSDIRNTCGVDGRILTFDEAICVSKCLTENLDENGGGSDVAIDALLSWVTDQLSQGDPTITHHHTY